MSKRKPKIKSLSPGHIMIDGRVSERLDQIVDHLNSLKESGIGALISTTYGGTNWIHIRSDSASSTGKLQWDYSFVRGKITDDTTLSKIDKRLNKIFGYSGTTGRHGAHGVKLVQNFSSDGTPRVYIFYASSRK